MCGIFGVISATGDHGLARDLALALLKFSETRGREAAGIAVHDGDRIEVLKQGGSVTEFLANPTLAITGHSRLAFNGTATNIDNNQPVTTHGAVALHNGIIVNDRELKERY